MANAGEAGLIPGQEDALEKEKAPTPVFLLGKSHGQKSLDGLQSMRSQKVSDTT